MVLNFFTMVFNMILLAGKSVTICYILKFRMFLEDLSWMLKILFGSYSRVYTVQWVSCCLKRFHIEINKLQNFHEMLWLPSPGGSVREDTVWDNQRYVRHGPGQGIPTGEVCRVTFFVLQYMIFVICSSNWSRLFILKIQWWSFWSLNTLFILPDF